MQHLGHEYDNPHKWIICLLGDDNFTLNSNSVKNAANQKVNISILGLRSEEFGIRSKDYWQVCDDTEEGVFVNIKKKDSCRSILDQVAITFSVYKQDKLPIVTELSDSAL